MRTVRKEGALAHRTNHAGITASRLDSTCRAAGNSMPKVMLIYRARNGRALRLRFPRLAASFFSPLSLSLSLYRERESSTRSKSIPHEFNCSSSSFFLSFVTICSFPFLFFFYPFLFFPPPPPFQFGLQVLRIRCNFLLPFEMFDNIFVGSTAVFPNRPGPVDHKKKRHLRYDGET